MHSYVEYTVAIYHVAPEENFLGIICIFEYQLYFIIKTWLYSKYFFHNSETSANQALSLSKIY